MHMHMHMHMHVHMHVHMHMHMHMHPLHIWLQVRLGPERRRFVRLRVTADGVLDGQLERMVSMAIVRVAML